MGEARGDALADGEAEVENEGEEGGGALSDVLEKERIPNIVSVKVR